MTITVLEAEWVNSAWRQRLNFQVYTFIDSPWFQGGTPAINPVYATQVQYTSVWPFSENEHPLFCWDGVIVKFLCLLDCANRCPDSW